MAQHTANDTEHDPRPGEWYSDAGHQFEVVANHGHVVDVEYAGDDSITPMDIELFRDGSVVPA